MKKIVAKQRCKLNVWRPQQDTNVLYQSRRNETRSATFTISNLNIPGRMSIAQPFGGIRSFHSFGGKVLSFLVSFFWKKQPQQENREPKGKVKEALLKQVHQLRDIRLPKPNTKSDSETYFEKYWSKEKCEAAKAEGKAVSGVYHQTSLGGVGVVLELAATLSQS